MGWEQYPITDNENRYRPVYHLELGDFGKLVIGEFRNNIYFRYSPNREDVSSYLFSLETEYGDTIADSDPIAIMPIEDLQKQAVAWAIPIMKGALDILHTENSVGE